MKTCSWFVFDEGSLVVKGECFLCRCVHWTVNSFTVSVHIELACFLSLFLYRAESSIGQRTLLLLLIRILRKTRANPVTVQDTKSTQNRTSVFNT